jgi:hypothetical protein
MTTSPNNNSTRTSAYPRHFLLDIYNKALTTGNCSVYPVTREEASKIVASFYRLRRRSTSSNASFITPEMHLVSAAEWHPHNGGTQSFIFNKQPDHLAALPNVT